MREAASAGVENMLMRFMFWSGESTPHCPWSWRDSREERLAMFWRRWMVVWSWPERRRCRSAGRAVVPSRAEVMWVGLTGLNARWRVSRVVADGAVMPRMGVMSLGPVWKMVRDLRLWRGVAARGLVAERVTWVRGWWERREARRGVPVLGSQVRWWRLVRWGAAASR